jgi:hypothetical protein
VAAVREDRQRASGLADLREDLTGPGLDVNLLAGAVHERPVDVEHEAADSV